MKTYRDFLNQPKKDIRESYIQGDLFKVGDIVEADGKKSEIISLGTNYITLVSEGKTFKKWINEVSKCSPSRKKKETLVSGALTFKGYSTKNFQKEHIELFTPILEHKDQFAVLNCIQSLDTLLGLEEDFDFDIANKNYSRAVKYFAKFGLNESFIEDFKEKIFEKAILENKIFVASGVADSCTSILKEIYSIEQNKSEDVLQEAVSILGKKQGYRLSEGWEALGSFARLMKANGISVDGIHIKTKTLMGV